MKKTINTQKIADACKLARKNSGLSLKEVAESLKALDLPYGMSSIQRFESGEQAIPFEVAVFYIVLGADLSCFLN